MPAKFTARIPSNVQYGYYEVEADTVGDLVEGEAFILDHLKGQDVVQEKAINTLTSNGVRTSLPGLSAAKPATSLGGSANGANTRPQQPQGDDAWKGVELGKLDDGTIITVHATGKYGPYVKARNIPGREKPVINNLPRGAAPEQIDLATAIGLIEQKMAA